MAPQERPRVLVVGWHRTGTTSLHVALQQLGYRVLGFDRELSKQVMYGDESAALVRAQGFDALRDFPWTLLYRSLDNETSDLLPILTNRDTDSWLDSYSSHHETYPDDSFHRWLYGTTDSPLDNSAVFVRRFEEHQRAVRSYFGSRLLEFNIFRGSGWEELASFVGIEPPGSAFPSEKSATIDPI